jgi:hypothetical protein
VGDSVPSAVGASVEREVAVALARAGWRIYLPLFAPHDRVDMVAARGSSLLRVQCKSGRLRAGAVVFRTCSNTGNVPHTYDEEVDAFGVHCLAIGRTFLVPADDLPTRACYLRLDPPANNQVAGVRLASDYEVGVTRPR